MSDGYDKLRTRTHTREVRITALKLGNYVRNGISFPSIVLDIQCQYAKAPNKVLDRTGTQEMTRARVDVTFSQMSITHSVSLKVLSTYRFIWEAILKPNAHTLTPFCKYILAIIDVMERDLSIAPAVVCHLPGLKTAGGMT